MIKKHFSYSVEWKCGQCKSEIRLHILCSLILIYTVHKSFNHWEEVGFESIIGKVLYNGLQIQILILLHLTFGDNIKTKSNLVDF